MKKLIFLIVFLTTLSIGFAAGDPSTTVSANVITPFVIWDVTPNGSEKLCDVIKGTLRTLPAGTVQLFEMRKETNRRVRLTCSLPNPIGNVTLTAQWLFTDVEPPSPGLNWPNPATTVINGQIDWYDVQTMGWIAIHVTQVDARNAAVTPGSKIFTATVTGEYINI